MGEDRRWSNSELATWRRCKRKWYLGHYRRLSPVSDEIVGARSLGNIVHRALCDRYLREDVDWRPSWSNDLDTDLERAPEREKEVRSQYDMARAMMEGYEQWVEEEGIDEDLELLGAEEKIEAPLVEGQVLIAKLDQKWRRVSSGAVLFRDFKTVGSLTEPLKTLHLDTQNLHYHLIYRLIHGDADRVDESLYTMLRKVKRSASAKPPFYGEFPVRHTDEELRSYWLRAYGEIFDILRAEDRLNEGEDHRVVAYPSPTKTCSWDCDFYAVCSVMDGSQRAGDDMLRRYFHETDPLARYADDPKEEGGA